jgi:hypothetical protein
VVAFTVVSVDEMPLAARVFRTPAERTPKTATLNRKEKTSNGEKGYIPPF